MLKPVTILILLLCMCLLRLETTNAGDFELCQPTDSHLLLISGKVAETRLTFLIDSGSTHNVISSDVLPSINTSAPHPVDGYTDIRAVEAIDIHVGKLRSNPTEPTLVMNLSSLSQSIGVEVNGILGMPFLADKAIQFTPQAVRISSEPCSLHFIIESLPCSFDNDGRLEVDTSKIFHAIGPKEPALIDTGMNRHLSLRAPCFESLRAKGLIAIEEKSSASLTVLGDDFGWKSERCGSLSTQKEDLIQNPGVHESEKTKLGTLVLRQCNACVDFKHKKLHFHPLPIGDK